MCWRVTVGAFPIIAVAIGLAACGSKSAASGNDPPSVVEQAIASHRTPEQATVAILLALRAGYTPTQIVDAIRSEALGPAGEIGVAPGRPAEPPSASEEADRKAADVVLDFFAATPHGRHRAWAAWVLTAGAAGYGASDILRALGRAKELAKREPETLSEDGVELALLRDARGAAIEPSREMDWPFARKSTALAIRIRIRPGSRPKGPAARPGALGAGTLQLKLTVSERSQPSWAMVSYDARLVVKATGGKPRIGGRFEVRLRDLKSTEQERHEVLRGTFEERPHELAYPVQVRLSTKYTHSVYLGGKRVRSAERSTPLAFGGRITSLWGSGTLTMPPASLKWEVAGLKYTGWNQPSGRIVLDPDTRAQMRRDAERMRKRAKKVSEVSYLGRGSFTLNVIHVNEITSDATYQVNLRPDGTVDGKITYNSVDIFSGKKVRPAKVMLLFGSYTAADSGRGSLTVSLESSAGRMFKDALTGTFDESTMNLSGRFQEIAAMTSEVILRAAGMRRR